MFNNTPCVSGPTTSPNDQCSCSAGTVLTNETKMFFLNFIVTILHCKSTVDGTVTKAKLKELNYFYKKVIFYKKYPIYPLSIVIKIIIHIKRSSSFLSAKSTINQYFTLTMIFIKSLIKI